MVASKVSVMYLVRLVFPSSGTFLGLAQMFLCPPWELLALSLETCSWASGVGDSFVLNGGENRVTDSPKCVV